MSNIIDNCSHMSMGLRRILISGGDLPIAAGWITAHDRVGDSC